MFLFLPDSILLCLSSDFSWMLLLVLTLIFKSNSYRIFFVMPIVGIHLSLSFIDIENLRKM